MKSRNIYFSVGLIFGLFLVASCSKSDPSDGAIEVSEAPEQITEIELTEEQFKTMKMEWGPLHTGEFSEEIQVQGTVQIQWKGCEKSQPTLEAMFKI